MKHLLALLSCIVLLNACTKDEMGNKLNISIDNQTAASITDVKIYANNDSNFLDSLIIDKVDAGQLHHAGWRLNNLPTVDGDFIIVFNSSEQKRAKEFGYFSNGTLLNKAFNIKIEPDTIIITQD